MAAVELILLQRVEKLGQMGEVVKVKPGYARNFLLPQKKALRATKDNLAKFERSASQLEAQNIKRREEAERVAERVGGLTVVDHPPGRRSRAASTARSPARDIADGCDRRRADRSTASRWCWITRSRRWACPRSASCCTPRSSMPVTVNVARSPEEAEKQARGEAVVAPPRKRTPPSSRLEELLERRLPRPSPKPSGRSRSRWQAEPHAPWRESMPGSPCDERPAAAFDGRPASFAGLLPQRYLCRESR